MSNNKKVDKLPLERRSRRFPLWGIGIITVGVIAGLFTLGLKRHEIETALTSGHTLKAQFSRDYLMLPDQTKVKIGGVPVGVVTGVQRNDQGVLVSMKIFGNNNKQLGTDPTAAEEYGTLLGGIAEVDLTPGNNLGTPQGTIPVSRTTVPVYLDSVLSSVPPSSQQGAKKFINQFGTTFDRGGVKDTQTLLAEAPGALQPSEGVLTSLEGDEPADLTNLVQYLEATDATVIKQQGQIEQVVGGLGSFSNTLGENAGALKELSGTLPQDLSNTRSGLTALDSTLNELDITSSLARPAVQELGKLIVQSQPTLQLANPVLGELEPFLTTTNPLFQQLVPTSTELSTFLNEINGPVLNRANNTIIPGLNKPQAVTDEEGATHVAPPTLYAAVADVVSGLDGVAAYSDGDGHYTPVLAGLDQNSVVPSPIARVPGEGAVSNGLPTGGENTDVCANGPTADADQGLGPCPGGSGTGDDLPGGASQGGPNVVPKSVTPPGFS